MFWSNSLSAAALMLIVVGRGANAFVVTTPSTPTIGRPSAPLYSSTNPLNDNGFLEKTLKESAEQMKSLTPQQMDEMMAEMDNMPAFQQKALQAMGMDVNVMKKSLQMMKENPAMRESVGKMMESMTPEQLLQQSKVAQENLKNLNQAASTTLQQPEATAITDTVETDEEEDDEEEDEPVQVEPQVLDAMFRVAELMSEPPEEGGVTFQGFSTVPPIAVLLAGDGEDDLTKEELKECWGKGSLGTSRIDRAGFERVWMEVQDQYYNDIVEEARDRTLVVTTKRGSEKPATTTTTATTTKPVVGAGISPEQLSDQVKNMSDDDMTSMFERMNNMTPADEERLKAMGVDPAMMKKSAEMMKSNPLLRKAATTMMKNTPPEQLIKASQQAQERMASMTEEEKKQLLE